MAPQPLNSASWLTVEQMMNKELRILRLDDSLRTVVQYYQESKLSTLPVVDKDENLIGVFPKKRLYRALLDGLTLDDPCTPYVVYDPIFVSSDLTYDEMSLAVRVKRSRVDYVVVVDHSGKVVGMIGTPEYLRNGMNVISSASALLESLFRANYEGVIIIDNDGYILRINPAAEKMFGVNLAEIKGKSLREVFPEITISDGRHLGIKQVVKSAPVIVNQVPILEDDVQMGTSITLLAISDAENIAHGLEIVKDLHTTLGGVLSASSDGVFVTDIFGTIRYANETASHLVSQTSEGITGMPIEKLLQTDGRARAAQSGTPEVETCEINGINRIVSHVPIMREDTDAKEVTGIVSKVYLDDKLPKEIAQKWFSLGQQVQYYRNELEKRGENSSFDQIVSHSSDFNIIKRDAKFVARSSSTILLTGESGVGKDMFARAIHGASPRARRPFIKVNCAAIPETLLESELFGYAPGSFTGASRQGKTGYFEHAHEGTIFLDEIGDMPLSIQVKILQVLQDKQFIRVGGTGTQKVDVRIIAATNRDLQEAIAQGAFREDLFYRLNVIALRLPPLRDRPEDILPLAESFIEKYNRILGTNVIGMSQETKEVLLCHNWPGNIRELENAIERAANYVWEGEIGTEHLPAHLFQSGKDPVESSSSYRETLSDVDKEIILNALKKAYGNKSAAARLLNISRSAFYDKLAKYGLQ